MSVAVVVSRYEKRIPALAHRTQLTLDEFQDLGPGEEREKIRYACPYCYGPIEVAKNVDGPGRDTLGNRMVLLHMRTCPERLDGSGIKYGC